MKANNNAEDNFNELLFEDRNKEYGAYALRSSYHEHITHSVLITTSIITTLIIISVFLTRQLPEMVSQDAGNIPTIPYIVTEVVIPPPPDKPLSKTPPQKSAGAGVATMVTDKPTDHKSTTNDKMDPNGDPNAKTTAVDSTFIAEPPAKVDPPPTPPKKERVPDVMPTLEDLDQQIRRHLRYPEMARENNVEGTVYVSFTVEADGSVTEVEVVKKVSEGCSEEAVRVVKLLKGWKPGIKNGKPVAVPCTLPIRFRLQ
jgi:protein TonB